MSKHTVRSAVNDLTERIELSAQADSGLFEHLLWKSEIL